MRRSNHRRRTPKKTAKRTVTKTVAHYARSLPSRQRRLHLAPPSSASEILETLGISSADLRAALEAIDS